MIELPAFDALALSLHHSPGVYAVLVGSGLSRSAGIPTGWEITVDLIRRLAALDGVTESDDWPKWYHSKYGREASYSEILDALASTPAERRSILQSYIEPADGDDARTPTKAHHAIAQLVASGAVRVIITTNFDRLLESALREAGVEPTVIASEDSITGATPLVHAKCTVIKVHGDYLDARIKNTDSELATYSPDMSALLEQVFDNFGLLVVGWSGEWDTALRSAILGAPSRRYPLYWAARSNVEGLARDLLEQRGGRSVQIADADSFFTMLGDTLDALKEASRPHPLSVEMAIALAKRYCRDDKYEMEWAEFLHAEVEKVRKYVTSADYPTVSPTKETLNLIVETFMARTEVLRRACLICGRWGTAEANRAVTRAIQSLSFASESKDGYTSNLSLREFGASVCFYWNLVGLFDRGDWRLVKLLLHSEIESDRVASQLVSLLPPVAYESVNWKLLNGLENHKTPVSDYLCARLQNEVRDISVRDARADELFDQVEGFITLEAGSFRLSRMKENTGLWFWVPVGRFMWNRSDVLKKLEALPDADPIFAAGLLGGSKGALLLIFQALRDFFKEIRGSFW